jgi:hypothetical protein
VSQDKTPAAVNAARTITKTRRRDVAVQRLCDCGFATTSNDLMLCTGDLARSRVLDQARRHVQARLGRCIATNNLHEQKNLEFCLSALAALWLTLEPEHNALLPSEKTGTSLAEKAPGLW